MKKLIFLAFLAACVYYTYVGVIRPAFQHAAENLPVQLDPRKGQQLVDKARATTEKANEAVSKLQQELTDKDK